MASLFSSDGNGEQQQESKKTGYAEKMDIQVNNINKTIRELAQMFKHVDKLNEGLPKLYTFRQTLIYHKLTYTKSLANVLRGRKVKESKALNAFYSSFNPGEDTKRKPTALDRDIYVKIYLSATDDVADSLTRQIDFISDSLATVDKMIYGVQSKIEMSR